MAVNEYHFITHWHIKGTIKEIAEVLGQATDLVRWWPSVGIALVTPRFRVVSRPRPAYDPKSGNILRQILRARLLCFIYIWKGAIILLN
jgi:hypothetical protein